MKLVLVMTLCLASGLAGGSGRAWAQATHGNQSPKQREAERKAMSNFAAGDYQNAVGIYSDLYADYRDPIYLRNIGRCYQRLKNPERAIASFEEYLAKAKRLSAEEKKEIAGFIAEMRELQTTQQSPPAARIAQEPAPIAPVPSPVPPAIALPERTDQPFRKDENPALAQAAEVPPSNEGIRWVGKGAIVLSGVLAVVGGGFWWAARSKFSSADTKCADKGTCGSDADKVDSFNVWSKIVFGGAAASAIAGGAILYIFPASASSPGLQAGVAWTF